MSGDIAPGLAIAVVDDHVSPQAALGSQAMTVIPDRSVLVSVTPTTIDNTDLSTSLIGLHSCLEADDEVEPHLNLHQSSYGYSHDNCLTGKPDLVARDVLGCSFILLNSPEGRHCTPTNASSFAMLQTRSVEGLNEECPPDCVHTKYSLQMVQTELSDAVKLSLQDKISSGNCKDDFKISLSSILFNIP